MKDGDAIISDELNHASIIDGIRLSKAQRHRYRNRDLKGQEKFRFVIYVNSLMCVIHVGGLWEALMILQASLYQFFVATCVS